MGRLGGRGPDRRVERPLRHGCRHQQADPPRARRGGVATAADPGRVAVIAVATVLLRRPLPRPSTDLLCGRVGHVGCVKLGHPRCARKARFVAKVDGSGNSLEAPDLLHRLHACPGGGAWRWAKLRRWRNARETRPLRHPRLRLGAIDRLLPRRARSRTHRPRRRHVGVPIRDRRRAVPSATPPAAASA